MLFQEKMTHYLKAGIPFFFLIDFTKERQLALTYEEAAQQDIYFDIKGTTNTTSQLRTGALPEHLSLQTKPIPPETYRRAFDRVKRELGLGNSFLLNLTFATEITPSVDLNTIFQVAKAPYKLRYKDEFVVFSPECYLQIKDGHVYSYPMKGTINGALPHAEQQLMESPKERYEHNTIVDLIRNDLSLMAKEVTVTKFRYLESIKNTQGTILQTSSEIRGKLPNHWQDQFAERLLHSLPAGSISGAPKAKTVEIINQVESRPRGFYTGIFGISDGTTMDSAVNIRYIEKQQGNHYFRSGGGLTHLSQWEDEYKELNEKIQVPTL